MTVTIDIRFYRHSAPMVVLCLAVDKITCSQIEGW